MTKTISEHRLVEVLGKLSHEIITTLWPVEYLLLAFLFFFFFLYKREELPPYFFKLNEVS